MQITDLLTYLQCPNCAHQKLVVDGAMFIFCDNCQSFFDVIEGVPVLMKDSELGSQEKKQIKLFNNHYSKFSDTEYKLENWRESMLNRIFDNDFKSKVKTYLDIGCGATGYTAIEGARRNNWLAIGVDSSVEAMIRAKRLADKENAGDKTAFVVCSAENLPFKKNIFDYISAVSVLEHLDNDKKVVANINYALKESGHVFVCVPNTYLKMWPFLWPLYYYVDLKLGHKRHYSIKKIDGYFNKHGLKRHKLFYNGHLLKLYQLLLEKFKFISDEKWWKMEEKDINENSMGVQLNAIYSKQE